MKTKTRTHLTSIEVCTLIARETVSLLDVMPEALPSVSECRDALELFSSVKELGDDGRVLLAWVDTEISNAKRFAADGTDLPYLIDPDRLLPPPDAAAQMDMVWALFEAAAAMPALESRQKLLNTARTIAEMEELWELVQTVGRPSGTMDTGELQRELADVRMALQANAGPSEALAEPQEVPSL